MATDTAVLRAVDVFAARSTAVRQRVQAYIVQRWGSMDAWRSADIDAFVRAVVPVVEAGQIQVAAITDAYLAGIETAVTRTVVAPIGVAPDVVSDLTMRGVTAETVYSRSGPAVWTALSNGTGVQAAVAQGLERALAAAATDLQLAHTHAARNVLERKPQVVGHRRVLTGNASCRLCVTASTLRYTKAELAPIHTHCDCKVLPIYGFKDPGLTINAELLADLKQSGVAGDLAITQAAARSRKTIGTAEQRIEALRADIAAETNEARRRRLEGQLEGATDRKRRAEEQLARRQDQLDDYRGRNGKPKTVIVHSHGELGPTLADTEHHWAGPPS